MQNRGHGDGEEQISIPVAEQRQTEKRARGKEKRNPDIIDRKIEPGMAKV